MRPAIAWQALLLYLGLGDLGFGATVLDPSSPHKSNPFRYELNLFGREVHFNPDSSNDLAYLIKSAGSALPSKEAAHELSESGSIASAKRFRRGLQELERAAAELQDCNQPQAKPALKYQLLELVEAVNNSQRPPVPKKIEAFTVPGFLIAKLRNPVGRGDTPATNLQPDSQKDLSLRDPKPTTFWQRPAELAAKDLYYGFGRTNRFELTSNTCRYADPKESFGLNPGFEVECNGKLYKVKFGEVSSEPFASRIFDALGYHVDPTDYCAGVRLGYDRRIFSEFHSRKPLTTDFTLFGFIPIYTLEMQKHFDPFNYVACAILRDGHRWSGAELKAHLFTDAKRRHPEDDGENFRPEVEAGIDYLITTAANVQQKETVGKNIGPWDFGQLDHAERRELRGAGLLGAWLGWFDTRFDNTRVRVLRKDGHTELIHYFSDLGGVLGETKGWLFARGERPNSFPWTFTHSPCGHSGPEAQSLPLKGYKPMEPSPAFAQMTIDDARWMARMIGQLTENQILQALVGSGYDAAEAKLYSAKLLSRRDRMLRDLELENEIKLFHPSGYDRKFSYSPAKDGPVITQVKGVAIPAPIGRQVVAKGKLKQEE